MRFAHFLLLIATAALLAGCPKRTSTVPEGSAGTTGAEGGAQTSTYGEEGGTGTQDLTEEQRAMAELERLGMTIYFDYDRAEIKPEFVSVVAAHARYLNAHPDVRVRLEGHTDERGSREYNIGLGERRAQAVRRALLLQGVREDQIVTVSYGEERPAVMGSDEAAYAKNRRVEISYPR